MRSHNVELDAAATLDLQAGTLQVDGGRLELNRSSRSTVTQRDSTIELSNGATSDVVSPGTSARPPAPMGDAL